MKAGIVDIVDLVKELKRLRHRPTNTYPCEGYWFDLWCTLAREVVEKLVVVLPEIVYHHEGDFRRLKDPQTGPTHVEGALSNTMNTGLVALERKLLENGIKVIKGPDKEG